MTADGEAAVAPAVRPRPLPFAWDRIALPAFILLMGLVFGSLNPNFFSWTNLTNVARQSSVLALLSKKPGRPVKGAGVPPLEAAGGAEIPGFRPKYVIFPAP